MPCLEKSANSSGISSVPAFHKSQAEGKVRIANFTTRVTLALSP